MLAVQNDIRNWIIYKITSPSGRIYIGKSYDFERRKQDYIYNSAKSQPLLSKSFFKHGFDNHKMDIIDSFVGDIDYVDGKEMFWIRSYMSNLCKYPEQMGMNLTDGGGGKVGYKCSDETRERMSNSAGWIPNAETRAKLRRAKAGKKYFLGKKHSEATIQQMIEVKAWQSGKPILQYDLNGIFVKEFISVRAAARETGVDVTTVRRSAKGKYGYQKKFIFKYKQ